MPSTDLVAASRLKDYRVQTHGNHEVGTVVDVVVELATAKVTHLLVAASSSLFTPTKHFLVPWSAVVVAYNEQLLTLARADETLQNFPEAPFDLTHRGLLAGAPSGAGASGSFMP